MNDLVNKWEEWISRFPSIKTMADRITGSRRRGSLNTVKGYVVGIYHFCEWLGFDDAEAALDFLRKENDVVSKIDGFIEYELNKGLGNGYVCMDFFGVKKWLITNGFNNGIFEKIDLPVRTCETRRVVDRAPTQDELGRVLQYCSLRGRATVLLALSSGLRVGTMLSLNWEDVDFSYPDIGRITVRQALGRKFSGSQRFFVTFLSPEARKVLEEYRDYRIRNGENSIEEKPVVATLEGERFSSTIAFANYWREILKKSGLDAKGGSWMELHFHTLRKYFRTRCEQAGVKRSYWEFWMGHKGEYLDESYFRATESEHVNEYRKAIPYLTVTGPTTISREEVRTEVISALMGKIGDAELAPIASKLGISPQQIRSMIRKIGVKGSEEETEALLETERTARNGVNNNNHESKLITEEELCSHIDEGWDLVKELSNGKILVKRPKL